MRIPTYDQKLIPEGSQESAFRSGVLRESPQSIPFTGRSAQARQGYAKILKEIGRDYEAAREQRALASAEVRTLEEYTKLNDQMLDPEFRKQVPYEKWNDYYRKRSDEINTDISKNSRVRSTKGRSMLKNSLDTISIKYASQIEGRKRQLQIDDMKYQTYYDLEKLSNEVIAANLNQNSVAISEAMKRVDGVLAGAVKAGFISSGEAESLFKKFQKDTQRGIFSDMVYNNPDLADELLKGWEGKAVDLHGEIEKARKEGDTEKVKELQDQLDNAEMDLNTIQYWQGEVRQRQAFLKNEKKRAQAEQDKIDKEIKQNIATDYWVALSSLETEKQSETRTSTIKELKTGIQNDMLNRNLLKSDGRELLDRANKLLDGVKTKSDPFTLSDINDRLARNDPNVEYYIKQAMKDNQLSDKDYVSFMKTATSQPIKDARSYISRGLDPRNLSFKDDEIVADLKYRYSQAIQWFNNNLDTVDNSKPLKPQYDELAKQAVDIYAPEIMKTQKNAMEKNLSQNQQELVHQAETRYLRSMRNLILAYKAGNINVKQLADGRRAIEKQKADDLQKAKLTD